MASAEARGYNGLYKYCIIIIIIIIIKQNTLRKSIQVNKHITSGK